MSTVDQEAKNRQWVDFVLEFSSQYGREGTISYVVNNLCGPIRKYPSYGDFTSSAVWRTYGPWWVSLSGYKQQRRGRFLPDDYVDLTFTHKVWPTAVYIYETYHPGSVVRILAADMSVADLEGSVDHTRWHVLWSGEPQADLPQEARIFKVPVSSCPFPTSLIRIELNQRHCGYYTEIEAVQLEGERAQPRGYTRNLASARSDLCQTDTVHETPVLCAECGRSNCCEETGQCKGDNTERCNCCKVTPAGNKHGAHGTCVIAQQTLFSSIDRIAKGIAELHIQTGLTDALEESDNSHFDLLPGEVIQHIISYLDLQSMSALACVSQLFRKHCYDPLQYVNLDLQPHWHQVTNEVLQMLAVRCRYLHSINLSWCGAYNHVTPKGFSSFLEHVGADLQTLRLASCTFADRLVVETIATHAPNLTRLDLASCVKVRDFKPLTALHHLTSLDLYRCHITLPVLLDCLRNNPKLEELNIGACASLENCDELAACLAQNCKQMRVLDMWRGLSLTQAGLLELANGCKLLEQVDIGWCPVKPVNGCLQNLASKCRRLKKLFLTANRGVSDPDLLCFALYLPGLQQLDVLGNNNVTPTALHKLLNACPEMRFLDISFCGSILDSEVQSLRHHFPYVDFKRSF